MTWTLSDEVPVANSRQGIINAIKTMLNVTVEYEEAGILALDMGTYKLLVMDIASAGLISNYYDSSASHSNMLVACVGTGPFNYATRTSAPYTTYSRFVTLAATTYSSMQAQLIRESDGRFAIVFLSSLMARRYYLIAGPIFKSLATEQAFFGISASGTATSASYLNPVITPATSGGLADTTPFGLPGLTTSLTGARQDTTCSSYIGGWLRPHLQMPRTAGWTFNELGNNPSAWLMPIFMVRQQTNQTVHSWVRGIKLGPYLIHSNPVLVTNAGPAFAADRNAYSPTLYFIDDAE